MVLICIAVGFAITEWVGEYLNNKTLIFISKPLVLASILGWMILMIDISKINLPTERIQFISFLAGYVFCLLGDIFFMLAERYFIPGLLAFLGGHIFYIGGFGGLLPSKRDLFPAFVLLCMIIIVTITVYKKISLGLDKQNNQSMKVPFAISATIISMMLFSAFLTLFKYKWNYQASFLVSIGAVSFYFSNILNGRMKSIGNVAAGRLKVMISYHLAQIFLAVGIVLHFSMMVNQNL